MTTREWKTSCDNNRANKYTVKVNSRNKRCAIYSKLTIKTPENVDTGVFIANFEHILQLFLVFLLLALKR